MIKKWLIRLVPIVFILISIVIMNSGTLLKQPFGKDDRLLESIKKLEANVEDTDWKAANDNIDYALKAWHKIATRIQFGVEREYIIDMNGTLDRLTGDIKAKNDQAIIEEIYYFYGLWKFLGK